MQNNLFYEFKFFFKDSNELIDFKTGLVDWFKDFLPVRA